MTSNENSNGKNNISVDVFYPNIAEVFAALSALPWFAGYSEATREAMKFVCYCSVNEMHRLIVHRMYADQDPTLVLDELRAELAQYEMRDALPRDVGTVN